MDDIIVRRNTGLAFDLRLLFCPRLNDMNILLYKANTHSFMPTIIFIYITKKEARRWKFTNNVIYIEW